MNKEQNKKVEDILGSLDGIKRAVMPDFFYTRLKARMENGYETAGRKLWIFRPVYALATLVIILLINSLVIFSRAGTNNQDSQLTSVTMENETLQSIAAEYNLNDTITEEAYK